MIRARHAEVLIAPREGMLSGEQDHGNLGPFPATAFATDDAVEGTYNLVIDREVKRIHGHFDRRVYGKREQSPLRYVQPFQANG